MNSKIYNYLEKLFTFFIKQSKFIFCDCLIIFELNYMHTVNIFSFIYNYPHVKCFHFLSLKTLFFAIVFWFFQCTNASMHIEHT